MFPPHSPIYQIIFLEEFFFVLSLIYAYQLIRSSSKANMTDIVIIVIMITASFSLSLLTRPQG